VSHLNIDEIGANSIDCKPAGTADNRSTANDSLERSTAIHCHHGQQ